MKPEGKMPQDYKPGRKKPNIKRIWISNDSELAEEFEEAEEKRDRAKALCNIRPDDANLREALLLAQQKYDELKDALREDSTCFVFESMGRRRFEDLVDEHPPTEQQVEEGKTERPDAPPLQFNPETIMVPLIAASLKEPKMSEREVREEIWDSDDWSSAEIMDLYFAALTVNNARRVVNLGKG